MDFILKIINHVGCLNFEKNIKKSTIFCTSGGRKYTHQHFQYLLTFKTKIVDLKEKSHINKIYKKRYK